MSDRIDYLRARPEQSGQPRAKLQTHWRSWSQSRKGDAVNLQPTYTRQGPPAIALLNRAFEVAYFILGDRGAALHATTAAMDKLWTVSYNQGRRLNYTPVGSASYPPKRTRINLSEMHLLQRLIYAETELFERLQEGQKKTISQEDLIIRYIKHLVRITTKYNSFYVALGISRLLYNYKTAETSEIYNFTLQDPERIRDDYYYRGRKRNLLSEIKKRFGDLIKTQRRLYREERFESQPDSDRYRDLVRESLLRFTPWDSPCVLPDRMDSGTVIPDLLFTGGDPDAEHQIELNRIHTLIHPQCLARLTNAIAVDDPEQRLELPRFFVSHKDDGPSQDRFHPLPLTPSEIDAIWRYLDLHASNRKQFSQQDFEVLVDGRSRSLIQLAGARPVTLNLPANAELVELRSLSDGGEEHGTPLFLSVLNYDHSGVLPQNLSAALGRKRRLSIEISPVGTDSDVVAGASLKIAEAPNTPKIGLLTAVRDYLWLSGRQFSINRPLLLTGLTALFIVFSVAGLWVWLSSRTALEKPTDVATVKDQPTPTAANSPSPRIAAAPVPSDAGQRKQDRVSRKFPTSKQPESPIDVTHVRGHKIRFSSVDLAAVNTVYVDQLGDDELDRELRDTIIRGLERSNRFAVTSNRDDADAVLTGSVRPGGTNYGRALVLQLVNADGKTVWALSNRKSGLAIPADAADAAAIVLRMLFHDARKR